MNIIDTEFDLKFEITLPKGSKPLYLFYELEQSVVDSDEKVQGIIAYPLVNKEENLDKNLSIGLFQRIRLCCTSIITSLMENKMANIGSKEIFSPYQKEHNIDSDQNTARIIHRVVRAMNDGECPKCHTINKKLVVTIDKDFTDLHPTKVGNLYCHNCQFTITKEEKEKAIQMFASTMNKNLEVFENWRNNL